MERPRKHEHIWGEPEGLKGAPKHAQEEGITLCTSTGGVLSHLPRKVQRRPKSAQGQPEHAKKQWWSGRERMERIWGGLEGTQGGAGKRQIDSPRAPMSGKNMLRSSDVPAKRAWSASGEDVRGPKGAPKPAQEEGMTFCFSTRGWFSIAPANKNAQRVRQKIPFQSLLEKAGGWAEGGAEARPRGGNHFLLLHPGV